MVEHPVFSALYLRGQRWLEHAVGNIREQQNQRATGRTLILGAGPGLDVPKLSKEVTDLVLEEPEPSFQRYLRAHYPEIPLLVSPAERLEAPDESFDTVLTSLVLCSVERLHTVLEEIHRVLVPGGQYLFLEHVRNDQPLARAVQVGLNPVWRPLASGCNLTRDVRSALLASRLELEEYQLVRPGSVIPIVAGRASRRAR